MVKCGTDYDLAILGGSTTSRFTALQAAKKGARVALLAPHWSTNNAIEYGFHALGKPNASRSTNDWLCVKSRFDLLCKHKSLSPTVLRSQGIDVILESASFTQNRDLNVGGRCLQASRYLLTDGYGFSTSDFESVDNSLECHQLLLLNTLPNSLTLVGSGAAVVEWAYRLSRFVTVTVLCDNQTLLPAEDSDIQRLVEIQLQCTGVFVRYLDSRYSDLETEPPQASADRALVVSVPRPNQHSDLALEAIGVSPNGAIEVNRYLQTRAPRLYVTGCCLGGEHHPAITQQETEIALGNVLFDYRRPMRYEQLTYGIDGISPVGRWGLTEQQAYCRYGKRLQIFQASCLPIEVNHDAQTSFCKLIALDNRLLGVHLLGCNAPIFAKYLGQCLTMPMLAKWATTGHLANTGSMLDAISGAIAQWENKRWQPGKWRRDWAENWFNWRRSW